MRWLVLILFCAVLITTLADPEPKKYKPKEKQSSTSLTNEERKFLREVEAKFGVKPEVPIEKKEEEPKKDGETPSLKPPFPAVIAIEIVNDTNADEKPGKGKRTIDANLGYGYQTNNGYTYSYFGNPSQEKGKFMIYPYSQEDIPPANPSNSKHISSIVEIQPSRAYELVPVKDEEPTSYDYKKPATEFKTGYENVEGLQSPPSQYADLHSSQTPSSTLYTTYNGETFSGLQGQFPKVMSNYLVNPAQLLQNPQYQSAGLTQDHLHTHGAQLEQRVVPVLVLRIPSSYLKNPSAELYANLPQNYPLSRYLNNVNLQELVNQYFKKIGYNFAPQIMNYPSAASVEQSQVPAPGSSYQPQQYANPYVRPSYTHSDYSGVQYSAVQPVMAKYPSIHSYGQQYYTTHSQPIYQQPQQKQNYEYRYQYRQQPAVSQQQYYVQHQYQTPVASHVEAHEEPTSTNLESTHDTATHTEYAVSHEGTAHEAPGASALSYEAANLQNVQQYDSTHNSEQDYESPKTAYEYQTQTEEKLEYNSGEVAAEEVGPTKVPIPVYGPAQTVASQYSSELTKTQAYYNQGQSAHPVVKETKTITIYPQSYPGKTTKYLINTGTGATHAYVYQNQESEQSKSLVLSENYPSKDHTQAAVLPIGYNKGGEPKQSISYVTPMPYASSKYHSQYRVMVPQTVFKPSEQVSYVNSHSLPMHYLSSGSQSDSSSEDEYTTSQHHVPPIGSQRPSSYPKNYHSHKRMTNKKDNKPASSSSPLKTSRKEQTEKAEQKKSS